MEYHKIETLYERDLKTHRLSVPLILKNRSYGLLKHWEFTEKIDGTNIRCIWKDGKLAFAGKTDNAQIHADLIKYLYEHVSSTSLTEIFLDTEVVIYGEGYGAGIQKGGYYRPDKALIVFDVLVGGKWWLNQENVTDVALKLGLDTVPTLGTMTLEQATEMVQAGFSSKIGTGQAEGVVGRPAETLFDKKGHRLILKLKTKDFQYQR